jgi:hypothetical protein
MDQPDSSDRRFSARILLIESKLILPSHLKHLSTNRRRMSSFARFQKWVADSLERGINKFYRPRSPLLLNIVTPLFAFSLP